MKVLNLQCPNGHGFEGWFASEQAFVDQCGAQQVQCPVCGASQVHKLPSAPRLNLASAHAAAQAQDNTPVDVHGGSAQNAALAAWMQLTRRMLEQTRDVGARFAEEARKMHYGEIEEQAIRGQTTPKEALALADEGIDVFPLLLPEALKTPLQ